MPFAISYFEFFNSVSFLFCFLVTPLLTSADTPKGRVHGLWNVPPQLHPHILCKWALDTVDLNWLKPVSFWLEVFLRTFSFYRWQARLLPTSSYWFSFRICPTFQQAIALSCNIINHGTNGWFHLHCNGSLFLYNYHVSRLDYICNLRVLTNNIRHLLKKRTICRCHYISKPQSILGNIGKEKADLTGVSHCITS